MEDCWACGKSQYRNSAIVVKGGDMKLKHGRVALQVIRGTTDSTADICINLISRYRSTNTQRRFPEENMASEISRNADWGRAINEQNEREKGRKDSEIGQRVAQIHIPFSS